MQTEHVKLAIVMDDGSLHIMQFITVGRGSDLPFGADWIMSGYWERAATLRNIENELDRTYENKPEQPVSYRVIQDGEIPTDRTFRDAWVDTGSKVTHDMKRARVIHLSRLRRDRNAKLDELDRDWMRASGQKNLPEMDSVETKRQALRDLPETLASVIEAATTVEELKTITVP